MATCSRGLRSTAKPEYKCKFSSVSNCAIVFTRWLCCYKFRASGRCLSSVLEAADVMMIIVIMQLSATVRWKRNKLLDTQRCFTCNFFFFFCIFLMHVTLFIARLLMETLLFPCHLRYSKVSRRHLRDSVQCWEAFFFLLFLGLHSHNATKWRLIKINKKKRTLAYDIWYKLKYLRLKLVVLHMSHWALQVIPINYSYY